MSAINETKIWSVFHAYYIQVYEILNRQFVNVKEYHQILWQCFSEGLLIGWTFIQIMPEILPTWIATGLVVVNSSCGELQVVVNYSNIGRTTSCWRWSQGALPPYTHPPGPADVITGFSGARMWLLVLLLQALVWCDYTFNTSTDHMSVASRYTISGQIDPATLPDDYKRGWNGWLQGVKLLITEGRWSIVELDWRVYDLISKEVWSEIIAHSQGYQSNFRMTTGRLYFLMTTRKCRRYQIYFRWLL